MYLCLERHKKRKEIVWRKKNTNGVVCVCVCMHVYEEGPHMGVGEKSLKKRRGQLSVGRRDWGMYITLGGEG